MSEQIDIDSLAEEALRPLQSDFSDHGYGDMSRAAEGLVALIRAVVRDELRKAAELDEARLKEVTQRRWDSPEFLAEVKRLSEGRPVLFNARPSGVPCCKPDGSCSLHHGGLPAVGGCCYLKSEVCPDHH